MNRQFLQEAAEEYQNKFFPKDEIEDLLDEDEMDFLEWMS